MRINVSTDLQFEKGFAMKMGPDTDYPQEQGTNDPYHVRKADTSFGARWLLFLPLPVVAYFLDGWIICLLVVGFLLGMAFGIIPRFWAGALKRGVTNDTEAVAYRREIDTDLVPRLRRIEEKLKLIGKDLKKVKKVRKDLENTGNPPEEALHAAHKKVKDLEAELEEKQWMPQDIQKRIAERERREKALRETADLSHRQAFDVFLILLIGSWVGLIGGTLLYSLLPTGSPAPGNEPSFVPGLVLFALALIVLYMALGLPWQWLSKTDRSKQHTVWFAYIGTPLGWALLIAWILYLEAAWANSFP